MSLFKKKISLDDIVAAFSEMTPEEKEQLKAMLDGTTEEEATDETTEETTTETEEVEEVPTEEPTEEAPTEEETVEETAPVDEAPTEEAPEEEAVEEEMVEEEVPETPEETTPEVDEPNKDDTSELYAMIADLKKTVEALAARINADAENEGEEDETEAFGITPNNFGGNTPPESDLDKIKAKYWNL